MTFSSDRDSKDSKPRSGLPSRLARSAFAAAIGLVLAAAAPAQPASGARGTCLHYEPELVRLSGTLEHAAFSDSPGGSAWVLRLPQPICTTGPDEVNRPERDVREVELAAKGGLLSQFAALDGGPVTASGTLFHSRDRHPRTAVLMAVRGVSKHAPGDARPQPNLSGNLTGNPKPRSSSSGGTSSPRRDERPRTRDEALLDALLRDLNEHLSPPSALELAALQARWLDLAERECRWEARVPDGHAASPSASADCLDRARRDRIRRLRDLTCTARGLPVPCDDSRRYDLDER